MGRREGVGGGSLSPESFLFSFIERGREGERMGGGGAVNSW